MFTQGIKAVVDYLETRARDFAQGCEKVYVSVSGGVDSTVVVTILCRAFGPENVVAVYRDLRSNPKHLMDVENMQKALGFNLLKLNLNDYYDNVLGQLREQMISLGLGWCDEGTDEAKEKGWENGYASFKSRAVVPVAGFLAKVVDRGRGRIFGTGNAEEDLIFRFFDKYGDGAVDNNLLVGLFKVEVRQLALWFAKEYEADVFRRIAEKIPSPDLRANGDAHNDEDELSDWARQTGFNIRLSYGNLEEEGNIAWVTREDFNHGIITGERKTLPVAELAQIFDYSEDQIQLVEFARLAEQVTRHKEGNIPGVTRQELRQQNLVD